MKETQFQLPPKPEGTVTVPFGQAVKEISKSKNKNNSTNIFLSPESDKTKDTLALMSVELSYIPHICYTPSIRPR